MFLHLSIEGLNTRTDLWLKLSIDLNNISTVWTDWMREFKDKMHICVATEKLWDDEYPNIKGQWN